MKVYLKTFGCKMNQYETELIRENFENNGFQIVINDSENFDILFINTCTVTAKVDSRIKSYIKKIHKRHPNLLIVVGGCLPQVWPDNSLLKKADIVLGSLEKYKAASVVKKYLSSNKSQIVKIGNIIDKEKIPFLPLTTFKTHTRAFIRIQDGCDESCTYCIIPKARGRPVSVPEFFVLKQIETLIESGYKEIVLLGTHLGQYGVDKTGKSQLVKLVKKILSLHPERLRFSSIEPQHFPEKLIELIANNKNICRHLHIPLQSGSDKVLFKMNRKYTTLFYKNLVSRLFEIPDMAIGADVITGFPQETNKEHNETLEFISELKLTYLHVFRYSQRPGTIAASMSGQVKEEIKKQRARELLALSDRLKKDFFARFKNRQLTVLVEGKKEQEMITGITDNYIRVLLPQKFLTYTGKFVNVKLTAIIGYGKNMRGICSEL